MRFIAPLAFAVACVLLPHAISASENTPPAQQSIGGSKLEDWKGVEVTGDSAKLKLPGEATYIVPDSQKGGLNALGWYGLRFEAKLDNEAAPVLLDVTLQRPPTPPGERQDVAASTKASLQLSGKEWQTLTLPFAAFDYNRGQTFVLTGLRKITFSAHDHDRPDTIELRNIRLVRGNVINLGSEIQSQPADADRAVTYTVDVMNCADSPQVVALSFEHSGWEGMHAEVQPESLSLAPGASGEAKVNVTAPGWLPAGAQETQMLVATPQAEPTAAEKLPLITVRRVPFPFLAHTAAEWDEVKKNAETYDWAKAELRDMVRHADAFTVPQPRPPEANGVFQSYIERDLWPCAVAWKLTGERRFAEKIALFLLRLSDPKTGYPTKQLANSADMPQEGALWEVAAWSYELICDTDILSREDKLQIEKSFRRYVDWNIGGLGNGGISNWTVFNLCPGAECALLLHDMVRFNQLMNGPCGIIDHLRYGMMDDGWWYEMALSYNLNVAQAFTSLGLATRAFGIDFLNARYPVATTHIVGLRPFEFQSYKGMAFGKYGPVKDNSIWLKKMWDGIVNYPDYRSIMFGIGDGHEQEVGGPHFDKAYYAFHDPAYATIIKQGGKRDLLYAVPELPAVTPRTYSVSTHSDDAGIAVLRSQTAGREQREQIQASFKFGTHGSYHGHFDRIALNSLMRYGRSFYNPETSWFGYGSYMYKWWVQVSLSHNMVVVDDKMQEPQECTPLLYYSGTMIQTVAAETNARWSNPPYFGGYDQIEEVRKGDKPYVSIPDKHPIPGEVTGYTEPVRQRRIVIVTDDYIVLADYLQGRVEHTFENLLQLRGAMLSGTAQPSRHDAQLNPDPLGSGQFITNVDRYAITAPALVHSIHRFGDMAALLLSGNKQNWETGGAGSLSVAGILQINEHILWPQKASLAIGDYAENWKVYKKLSYEVTADDQVLASGTFGAWMLGSGKVDVPLAGAKLLRLNTRTQPERDARNTIFWGNPAIVTADGKELPLSKLKLSSSNIIPAPEPNLDYEKGPVRIAGVAYGQSVAAEPEDTANAGTVTIDLSGVKAVRFKATIGGDWPVGNEEQLRKTIAVQSTGKEAHFLTLLEPFEKEPIVKNASATAADKLRVELTDGRVQEIAVENLASDRNNVIVHISETKDGKSIRSEQTNVAR